MSYTELRKKPLMWSTIVSLAIAVNCIAKELPDGVTMKETVPISNPMMTQSSKDYYRNGTKFFSDVNLTVPEAKGSRSYYFYHDGFMILSVDAGDQDTHFAGDKNYRVWVWESSVTIFCLDDDFYLFVEFDESGDPVFQSNEEQALSKKSYIANKEKYRIPKD